MIFRREQLEAFLSLSFFDLRDVYTASTIQDGDLFKYQSNVAKLVNFTPNYTINTIDNGIIDGGVVTWLQSYEYNIGPAQYYINSTFYTSPVTDKTLSPADPDFDRIDLFVLTTSGSVEVVEGDPAANPVEPDIDASTQLKLSFVLVQAASTAPNMNIQAIYAENNTAAEWSGSTNRPTRIKFNSTASTYAGTYSMEGTGVLNNDFFVFFTASLPNLSPADHSLNFKIKSKGAWGTNRPLIIRFMNGHLTLVGTAVSFRESRFGFRSSNTTTWQNISIPLTQFGNITNANGIRFTRTGDNVGIGFYIDNMYIMNTTSSAQGAITLAGDVTGTGTTNIPTTLSDTGVVAGTYTNLNATIDSKGRILTASNGTGGVGGFVTTSSFNSFTSSYRTDSSSFDERIRNITSSTPNLQQVTDVDNETTNDVVSKAHFGFSVKTLANQVLSQLYANSDDTKGLITLYTTAGADKTYYTFDSIDILKGDISQSYYYPKDAGSGIFYLPLSVNGYTASVSGNITIPTGSASQRFGIEDNTGVQDRDIDMQNHYLYLTNVSEFYANVPGGIGIYSWLSGSQIGGTKAGFQSNDHAVTAGDRNSAFIFADKDDGSEGWYIYAQEDRAFVRKNNGADWIDYYFPSSSTVLGGAIKYIPLAVNGYTASIDGNITIPTGSAAVDTSNLTTTSSFQTFTASYYTDSSSFDTRIMQNITGSIDWVAKFTGLNSVGKSGLYESGGLLQFTGSGNIPYNVFFGSASVGQQGFYLNFGFNNRIAPSGGGGTGIVLGKSISAPGGYHIGEGLSTLGGVSLGFGTNGSLYTSAQTARMVILPSTPAITFTIAEVERARFDNTGSLLIGTTAGVGGYKLQVTTGSAAIAAKFTGRVIGSDAINSDEFATLGQVAAPTVASKLFMNANFF